MKSLNHVQLFATPWTVAYQASLTMGFSRQKYQSALPFPSPGDLSDPGIEPGSPTLQADSLPSKPPGKSYYLLMKSIHFWRALTGQLYIKVKTVPLGFYPLAPKNGSPPFLILPHIFEGSSHVFCKPPFYTNCPKESS